MFLITTLSKLFVELVNYYAIYSFNWNSLCKYYVPGTLARNLSENANKIDAISAFVAIHSRVEY